MAYVEVALMVDNDVAEIVHLDNETQVENYAKSIGEAIELHHVRKAVGVMCLWHNHAEVTDDEFECECRKPENTRLVAGWNLEQLIRPSIIIVVIDDDDDDD